MLNQLEMKRKLRGCNDKLNIFCTPLTDYLNISQFYYYHVSNAGHLVSLGSNHAWDEFFYSDKSHLIHTPYFRHPDNFLNGVSFIQNVEYEQFEKILQTGHDKFNVNLSLQFMNKTKNGLEAFGFGIKSKTLKDHLNFSKELPLLRLFVKKFKEEFQPTIQPLLNESQIDIGQLIGPDFYKVSTSVMPEPRSRRDFLKKMGVDIFNPLTAREYDVIKYLLKGYSASQIADELFLSTRTVEHYLERIKDKLGCISKTDLIQNAILLESIGEIPL